MKIKATPLEHHLAPKLPKVSTPNLPKKRPQTPKAVVQMNSEKIIQNKNKNITAIIFNKKKSIDCAQYPIKKQAEIKTE